MQRTQGLGPKDKIAAGVLCCIDVSEIYHFSLYTVSKAAVQLLQAHWFSTLYLFCEVDALIFSEWVFKCFLWTAVGLKDKQ